jgi:hypothetical protein
LTIALHNGTQIDAAFNVFCGHINAAFCGHNNAALKIEMTEACAPE